MKSYVLFNFENTKYAIDGEQTHDQCHFFPKLKVQQRKKNDTFSIIPFVTSLTKPW